MNHLQHLVNMLNQILAALLAIVLAIWQELRNARKAKGLTIEEAAELFGVAPVTYSRWERLRQIPHPLHRLHLFRTFELDGEDGGWDVPNEWLPPSYWD